jgi:hypothetical protein
VTIPGIRLAADDAMELTELPGSCSPTGSTATATRLPASLAASSAVTPTTLFLGGDEQPYFGTSDL